MPASTKSRTAANRTRATSSTPKRRTPAKGGRGGAGGRAAGRTVHPRARRSLFASRRGGLGRSAPVLESHHVDIAALALIAVGIFIAGVAYAGWSGGALGGGAVTALRFLLGALGYLVPATLVLAGALILLREMRPPARPLRTGTICLTIALTLGLAAGTFGIGPGAAPAGALWHATAMEQRGGIVGAFEYWVCTHLISPVGADILAVFLLVAGVILVSGAGIAGTLQMTGARVANTGRALREVSSAGTLGRRPATPAAREGERIRGRRSVLADPEDEAGFDPLPDADLDPEGIVVSAGAPPLDALPVPEPAPAGEATETAGGAPADEAPGALDALPELGLDEEPALLEDDEEDADGRAGPGRDVGEGDLTPQGRYRASVTEDPDFVWRVPSARFLTRSTGDEARPDTAGQAQTARALIEALGHFGIEAQVVGKVSGPHITRYEIRLAPGVKMSKVANLKDDLAYALAATDIRILAPIPGKQAVGIEVPNARRRIVHLGDVISAAPEEWSPLTVWLGKDIAGKPVGADLAKMPHLLVAGTTGAGKSACVNSMLSSILLRATPHEVRLVLVDPKQVELNHYESIPHLLTPVITSPRQAANALQNLVREMEQRYSIMQLARTRSLPDLNRVRESRGEPPLPYILCVIDELADLMMVAPADVEDSIIRLAQKARAVGMHLVLATQSPRVDVITGMIKANVPSRIAFSVSSQTDSRVILDQNGAESLLGQGDMLFSPVGSSRLQRIQGAFVDEPQILEITEAWRKQGEPDLQEQLLEEVESEEEADGKAEDPNDANSDPLLEEAIALVAQMGTASTSMLQRRLRLGYTRAGRLIDMLERRGIISGYEGSKPRQVLISEADVPRILVHLAEAERGGSPAGGAAEPGVSEAADPAEETVAPRAPGPGPDAPPPAAPDAF
jgi:S-DNA-T family DNA segregation ATPase FtsK/SpoIIIE